MQSMMSWGIGVDRTIEMNGLYGNDESNRWVVPRDFEYLFQSQRVLSTDTHGHIWKKKLSCSAHVGFRSFDLSSYSNS
jgi:hypothetical protein